MSAEALEGLRGKRGARVCVHVRGHGRNQKKSDYTSSGGGCSGSKPLPRQNNLRLRMCSQRRDHAHMGLQSQITIRSSAFGMSPSVSYFLTLGQRCVHRVLMRVSERVRGVMAAWDTGTREQQRERRGRVSFVVGHEVLLVAEDACDS